jgi:hypothetical protein
MPAIIGTIDSLFLLTVSLFAVEWFASTPIVMRVIVVAVAGASLTVFILKAVSALVIRHPSPELFGYSLSLVLVTLVSSLYLFAFSRFVFPALPAWLAGGSAQPVVLTFKPEYNRVGSALGIIDSGETRSTPLTLYASTDKYFLLLVPGRLTAIALPKDDVASMEMQVSQ